jgi:SNF2 family DNA or RNA helicase
MSVITITPRKSLEPYLLDSVTFYPHQIAGVRKLLRMKSFLLADDMGLGKSLQALTVFCADVKTGAGDVCIVICPVTLKANWADEIEKFTRIKYMVLGEEFNPNTGGTRILSAGERSRQIVEFANWNGPKILILNYEQVGTHLPELNALNAHCLIFDEAHYIKGHASKRTQASLALRGERSFLLTGTPILNQVNELWSLLNRISPRHFPNYFAFVNRYCIFGGYKNKQIVGVKNQKQLQRILDQVMLRRLKKDVLTIPQPYYIQVPVDLHPLQRKLYDQADEELRLDSFDPNADPLIIENALVKFTRLKQICCTPATLGYPDNSYKLDSVVEKGSEVITSGEKLVVYTQFRPGLECLANRFDKLDIPVIQLHGDVPKSDRISQVKEWSLYPEPIVLLCMTQVAQGFNATAAKVCFFVDKLFVPGLNQQAVDRLHRIGQQETQPIQVYEFIARRTKEARIEKILRDKKKLFENVIDATGIMAKLLQALKEADEK